jgi:hypothetical protein
MNCRIIAALPLLFSAVSANAQAIPTGASDTQIDALNAQARRVLDQTAQTVLMGRPGIAIIGVVIVNGSETTFTKESVRDAAELVLRRNGIPIVASCDGGPANCGRLVVMVRANCAKGLVLPDPSVLCAVYLKVGYLEVFRSGRPESVPSTAFGDVIDYDGVKLTAGPFEEGALKQMTAWIDGFALSYLRANPAK